MCVPEQSLSFFHFINNASKIDWNKWIIRQLSDGLVHPNDDIMQSIVDRKLKASISFQGNIKPRRMSNEEATVEESEVEEDVNDDEMLKMILVYQFLLFQTNGMKLTNQIICLLIFSDIYSRQFDILY